jgi:hypothetical protein
MWFNVLVFASTTNGCSNMLDHRHMLGKKWNKQDHHLDVLHVSISRHDIQLLFVDYLHTKRRNDFELKVPPTMVCLRERSQSKIGTSYRNISSLGRYRWVIACHRMRQCIVSPAVCLLELYGRHDSNQR